MVDNGGATGWEQVAVLNGHADHFYSVCWSPDGSRLASASADETVRVWAQQAEIGLGRPPTGEIGLRRPGNV